MVDPSTLEATLQSVVRNEFSTGRFEALLHRPQGSGLERLPVHVIVTQVDHGELVLIELVEVEQQSRQDREARTLEQARVTKELIRNLAHEIKNPLGGIRGAAQLLERELDAPPLIEYTQVIIGEADRLQSLVNRLLTPHRLPQPARPARGAGPAHRLRGLLPGRARPLRLPPLQPARQRRVLTQARPAGAGAVDFRVLAEDATCRTVGVLVHVVFAGAVIVGSAAGDTVITLDTEANALPHASVAVHVSVTSPPHAPGVALKADEFDVPLIKQPPLNPLLNEIVLEDGTAPQATVMSLSAVIVGNAAGLTVIV